MRLRLVVACVLATAGCGLFPSLDGLTGSADADPIDAQNDVGDAFAKPDGDAAIDVPPAPGHYKRVITIVNNASTALPAYYTIGVPFPAGDLGLAVGSGKMRSDYNDLRVVGAAGERDRMLDSSPLPSVVWFSIASPIAAGATDTSYAITYGDPNAGPAPTNGAAIFAFYDDFSGSAVDTNIWMTQGGTSVAGGLLTLPQGQMGALTTTAQDSHSTVEMRVKITDPTSPPDNNSGFYYWYGFQHTGDFTADAPWVLWIARSESIVGGEDQGGSCSANCTTPTWPQDKLFHIYGVERAPTLTNFDLDGVTKATSTTTNDGALSLMIRSYLPSSDVVVDWVRAHPVIYPVPTVTLGQEQPF